MNPKTEKAIQLVLGTDDLTQKMVGMQLTKDPDLTDLGSTGEYWRNKEKAE